MRPDDRTGQKSKDKSSRVARLVHGMKEVGMLAKTKHGDSEKVVEMGGCERKDNVV